MNLSKKMNRMVKYTLEISYVSRRDKRATLRKRLFPDHLGGSRS
jgi:hypothetical protein